MSTVYIIEEGVHYEGRWIRSVHLSEADALQEFDKLCNELLEYETESDRIMQEAKWEGHTPKDLTPTIITKTYPRIYPTGKEVTCTEIIYEINNDRYVTLEKWEGIT